MGANSTHGAYNWVPDFFRINYSNSNMTMDVIQKRYSNLTIVKRVEEVIFAFFWLHSFWLPEIKLYTFIFTQYGESYKERIHALRSHCNTVIQIDNDVSNDVTRKDMRWGNMKWPDTKCPPHSSPVPHFLTGLRRRTGMLFLSRPQNL